MVDGDIEEALDLLSVEIDGEDAVGTGSGQEVGDQLSRDGHAGLVLTILTGIAEEWNDRGDAGGRSAAQGINHDEQLHDAVVGWHARGLNDEDIATADILVDLHERLAVGEAINRSRTQRLAEVLADFLGERRIGVPSEDFHRRQGHGLERLPASKDATSESTFLNKSGSFLDNTTNRRSNPMGMAGVPL